MSQRRPNLTARASLLLRPTPPNSDALAEAVLCGPRHWRPIFADVQDGYTSLVTVAQNAGPFRLAPSRLPVILYVGDDPPPPSRAQGPAGFDRESLRLVIETCSVAVIVACQPIFDLYRAAAESASVSKLNTVLIETRGDQEIPWVEFVRQCRPNIGIALGSATGGTA